VARIAAYQARVPGDAGGIASILVLEEARNVSCRKTSSRCRPGGSSGCWWIFSGAIAVRYLLKTISLYFNALLVANIAIKPTRGYTERGRRTEKRFTRVYMEKRL
jgi:hypothetical protein